MKIKANGKIYELEASTPLHVFLESLHLNPRRCLIELNSSVVAPDDIFKTILKEGDVLEILQLVAGG